MFLSRDFLGFEWVVNLPGLKLQSLSFLWWAAAEIPVEVILLLSELHCTHACVVQESACAEFGTPLCGSPFQSFPLHLSAVVKAMKPAVWVFKPTGLWIFYLNFHHPAQHRLSLLLDKNSAIPFFQMQITFPFLLLCSCSSVTFYNRIYSPYLRVTNVTGTAPPFLKARNCHPGSVLSKGSHFVITSVPCSFFPGLLGIVFLVSLKQIA